jgi:hypothetical protein
MVKTAFFFIVIIATFETFCTDNDVNRDNAVIKNENLEIDVNVKNSENQNFKALAETKSAKYLKRSKGHKITSNIMFFVGALATMTGTVLFIHDKAGGTNSLPAQYSLLLGGLSILNLGIAFNASSSYSLNKSESYLLIAKTQRRTEGKDLSEYYESSGFASRTKKMSARSLKKHGGALMLMSLPLFAITIYSFFDSHNYYKEKYADKSCGNDDCGLDIALDTLLIHTVQVFTLGPAVLSFISGFILLAKASKYEKLSTEPSILTLNSIAPIIDPVSKTYGIALGFSF